MLSLRPLAMTVSAFTMAIGGIAFGAGSASATYSACLDTVVANGGRAAADIVVNACENGASKNFASCVTSLQAPPTEDGRAYGPELSKAKAELACKRAAVLPAP